MVCGTQPGQNAVDGRSLLGPVVDEWERELEPVFGFPDGDDLLARLVKNSPAPLRERLAAETRERLRRAEPLRGAADEQDSRRGYEIRHDSV